MKVTNAYTDGATVWGSLPQAEGNSRNTTGPSVIAVCSSPEIATLIADGINTLNELRAKADAMAEKLERPDNKL